ncbi:hypothetical protein ACSBR2_040022 [Camellia fascicularis]
MSSGRSIEQHFEERRHCLEAQKAAMAATKENNMKGSHLDVKLMNLVATQPYNVGASSLWHHCDAWNRWKLHCSAE